ncbi:MAG TPA: YfhO family protein, partial [Thermoanaerobaculia bacterium]|nr:YfhO family protein [Thermoanaerobaculia bacterium]
LLPTVDLTDAMWKVRDGGASWWRPQFMAMANAWYVTEYRPFEKERARVGGKLARAQALEYRKTGEPPRYYFADEVVRIRDRADFIAKLKAKRWSDRVAFVASRARTPAAGRVVSVVETANTARIDVVADGAAFLVMSVTPHKYWTATIDGAPALLETVNIGFQGVAVPEGTHRVEMRYENTLVNASAAVSAGAFLLLGAIAFAAKRPPRLAPAVSAPDAAETAVAAPRADDVDEHPEGVAHDPDARIG